MSLLRTSTKAFRFVAQSRWRVGLASQNPRQQKCLETYHANGFPFLLPSHEIHLTASFRSADPNDVTDADWTEQRTPPSEKIVRLVDEISNLTLLEVSDLTTLLRKKLGLSDMPMMPMMPMHGGPPPGLPGQAPPPPVVEAKPEKSSFDIKLEKFDAAAKLKVIKEVRAITGLGLKESKELVEQAPAIIKKGVTKEEGESILEKLKAVTADCSLE